MLSPQSSRRSTSVRSAHVYPIFLALACLLGPAITPSAFAASSATTTSLAITSSSGSLAQNASVPSGTVLTLTATVTAGTSPVTAGTVSFCDATATLCSDIHLIATAQLTPAGTAVYKFIPGPGSHTYKAVFAATPNSPTPYAASSSTISTFTVSLPGNLPTTSTLTASGNPGNYTLTSTVIGIGTAALTGNVSFLDTTSNNAVLATTPLANSSTSLGFLDASSPDVGQDPTSNVIADFNGDGIPDLAVTGNDTNVLVFLGKGDGSFTAAPSSPIAVPFDARALTVGDFNHDGKLDLALVSYYYDAIVTVLLGNGDGSFTTSPGTPHDVGGNLGYAQSLVVGDFNGDGLQDLIAGVSTYVYNQPYNGNYVVLLGNGDGSFRQLPTVNTLQSATLTTGDFNRDGITDLAIADYFNGNDVGIYLGNGDGTFTQAPNSPLTVDQGSTSVVAADLNADGILDLAVSSQSGILAQGFVSVLIGKGDGSFIPAPLHPNVGISPLYLAYGDFNGDGKVDLATSNNTDDTVSYLLGNGDGTFQPVLASPYLGQWTINFATGDVNGDGITDAIAVTDSTPMGSYDGIGSVLLSQPTLTTTAVVSNINPIGTGPHQIDASFPGNSAYGASTSNTVTLTAQPVTPTLTLTPGLTTLTTAQSLTVAIMVSGLIGAPTPSGSITLTSGSFTSAPMSLSSGVTTMNIPAATLPIGTDTLTATYSGDTNYTALAASTTVIVTPVPPSFALSSTSVIIASPGSTTGNTSTLTITPAGGFTGTVTLSAALTFSPSGAVGPPTFSFTPASSVSVTGTTPVTATLTISTASATSRALPAPRLFHPFPDTGVLACLLFFLFPRRNRRKLAAITLGTLLALTLGSLSGCSSAPNTPPNPGTTPGAYTVTVTGTAGALTATTAVTLNVQ